MNAKLQVVRRGLLGIISVIVVYCSQATAQEIPSDQFRRDVEARLPPLEAAFQEKPDDVASRRSLAIALFQLGDFWRANGLGKPLADSPAASADDVRLGARLSFLLGDYDRAENLFKRLLALSEKGSSNSLAAEKGLLMVAYQTNQFSRANELVLTEQKHEGGEKEEGTTDPLLAFMQKFEGSPYGIRWHNDNQISHVPITNNFHQLGALPEVDIEVNGAMVHMILDTGGDRLYIDEEVAKKVGIRNIAKRTAKYAYTGGKTVEEPLGVAETVQLGDVSLSNVPVIVAKWKVLGQKSDGIVTTQILKQFLTTIDYANAHITFRPRSAAGKQQVMESLGDKPPITMPFVLAGSHFMFAKGGINDRAGLNLFVDSGLAASMPMVIVNETVHDLGLEEKKTAIQGGKYFWVPIAKLSLGALETGSTQALGNVLVEPDSYRRQGFFFDALISHQFLQQFGSWTIDFDAMQYYFPAR